MIEWIKIYIKQDIYQKHEEIEPGIVRIVKSMDRIRIKFRDTDKLRAIFLNSSTDTLDLE